MLQDVISDGLDAVEERLYHVVDSDVDVLNDASHHIIESGGKRLRPQLVFLAYLAGGGDDIRRLVSLAAAVELVHTATLVHDDINDHSLTRRGRITVHARWGRTFALLTGDYLFTKVYEMMAPYGNPYNEIMAEATVQLVEGETLQASAAKSGEMDRQTYKEIISRKTASLFRASAEMGARLAGADEEVIAALSNYAHDLGLAFQIVDDILDITGDPEKMGKPVGVDVAQGVGAAAVQNGQRSSGSGGRVAEAELDPLQAMLLRLQESGAIEVARAEAREIGQRARDALHAVPGSAARDELFSLVDQVIERER